jgi:chromosome segregation ATPase
LTQSAETASTTEGGEDVSRVRIEITVRSRSVDRLRNWHRLVEEERRLQAQIARKEERLRQLRADLDSAHQRAVVYDREPVQGGKLYDATGDYVADLLERVERTENELASLRHDLAEVQEALAEIADFVESLRPEYRAVVTMYYRDRAHWAAIERETHYSKTRIYEILNEVERACSTPIFST